MLNRRVNTYLGMIALFFVAGGAALLIVHFSSQPTPTAWAVDPQTAAFRESLLK